ncbi:hypothetical protein J1605_022790 [Eschrichtius robustus]|uniref:Uncharacterized protein n=1 Tax=Eschrichtius robustus TaxID=9764 RepID=A0AB34HAS7_ESCRO|nr:hypothetical protein J1605_022790 [Eschrichtius robustus]
MSSGVGGALMEASDGTWGSGLAREVVSGAEPTSLVPDSCGSYSWFPGSGEAAAAPPVGEGKRSCVGGGRSDADAKVAASGHHFGARKQNPGLKAAFALLAQYLVFCGP